MTDLGISYTQQEQFKQKLKEILVREFESIKNEASEKQIKKVNYSIGT